MQDGVLVEVFLPACIAIIMIAMGMTLTVDDFKRVLSKPKQVGIGFVCQMILLPAIGFLVAWIFPLEPVFAVSIVLLAATPGGSTSNLIIHAADGDRALSVTLTALSNSFVWITIPLFLSAAFDVFGDGIEDFEFPLGTLIASLVALTVLPVGIGMTIRKFKPALCDAVEEPSKIFAALLLAVVIVLIVIQNWDEIVSDGPEFAPAFIALNVAALATGFFVARFFGIAMKQSATIAIETGLQNSALAITIALSVLDNDDMAIIPGLYGVWMLVTGFMFAFLVAPRIEEIDEATRLVFDD